LYNPTRFKIEDSNEAIKFIDRYPFSTVISVVKGESMVSQLPLTAQLDSDGNLELVGHLAKSNIHSRYLGSAPSVLTASIVGFRIRVRNLEFKRKLSQNRSAKDRARILKGLAVRTDGQSQEVLQDMQNLFDESGEFK
jgi:predicted FMN-binding regulatory protein PaiB